MGHPFLRKTNILLIFIVNETDSYNHADTLEFIATSICKFIILFFPIRLHTDDSLLQSANSFLVRSSFDFLLIIRIRTYILTSIEF